MIKKFVQFIFYKAILNVRRRYRILERFFLKTPFGDTLLKKIYLLPIVFYILFNIGVIAGLTIIFQKMNLSSTNSYLVWQVYFFILLIYSILNSFMVSSKTFLLEDLQILARLPLSKKQLAILVFSEDLSAFAGRIIFKFIIPIGIPLFISTKEHLSLGMTWLAIIYILIVSLLLKLVIGTIICCVKLYISNQVSLLKTLLIQGICVFIAIIIPCFLVMQFLENELNRFPADFNADPEAIIHIFQKMIIEKQKVVTDFFQKPFWPHTILTRIIHVDTVNYVDSKFVFSSFLILIIFFCIIFISSAAFAKFFLAKKEVSVKNNRCSYNMFYTDNFSPAIVVFKKNLILLLRNMEFFSPSAIFGGICFWMVLGIVIGMRNFFIYLFQNGLGEWQIVIATFGVVSFASLLIYLFYHGLRPLISIDVEGRNVSLLRLANISLTHLFASQVRLLLIVLLPAFSILVIALGVLGYVYQFIWQAWLVMITNLSFVLFIVPAIILLGSAFSPRFDNANFAESGKHLEQKIADDVAFFLFFGFVNPLLLIPGFLFFKKNIGLSLFFLISGAFYGTIMVATYYGIKIALEDLGKNIKQGEDVL